MIWCSSASTQSAATEAACPALRMAQAAQSRGRYAITLGIWARRIHAGHMPALAFRTEAAVP